MATKQVYCAIRRQWVAATPEEMVRQRLLLKLTQQLSFPSAHIAVEVSLQQLSQLASSPIRAPHRRADIVCFANALEAGQGLSPLLLIECKAVPLNDRVIRQTTGYNRYVKAHFVAVINESEEKFGWWDASQQNYVFAEGLPSYLVLREMLSPANRSALFPH